MKRISESGRDTTHDKVSDLPQIVLKIGLVTLGELLQHVLGIAETWLEAHVVK